MRITHDNILEITSVYLDDECPTCRVGTPIDAILPYGSCVVSLYVDAPGCNGDMTIPRVFGARYPHDTNGFVDFDGNPEYIELKVSIKGSEALVTSQKFKLYIENPTSHTVNPGYFFVF